MTTPEQGSFGDQNPTFGELAAAYYGGNVNFQGAVASFYRPPVEAYRDGNGYTRTRPVIELSEAIGQGWVRVTYDNPTTPNGAAEAAGKDE